MSGCGHHLDGVLDFINTLFGLGIVGFSMHFWVLNGSNAGNVKLQWAQSTSSASPLTFKKGSQMNATRVA